MNTSEFVICWLEAWNDCNSENVADKSWSVLFFISIKFWLLLNRPWAQSQRLRFRSNRADLIWGMSIWTPGLRRVWCDLRRWMIWSDGFGFSSCEPCAASRLCAL